MQLGGWLLGALLGMRHALEPDHLVAVCTLVGPGKRLARRSAALGALWGVGHTVSLVLVTSILGALQARLPDALSRWLEVAVAAMLILLGLRALRRGLASTAPGPLDSPTRHLARSSGSWRPVAVGMMHGLAGSGTLAVLMLATLPTTTERLLYTAVFGAGSVFGMSALSMLASLPMSIAGRERRVSRALIIAAGVLSIGGGLAWAVKLIGRFPD